MLIKRYYAQYWYWLSDIDLLHSALPVNSNFDQTNLSHNVFGLQKIIRGGLDNIAFRTGDFCTCQCSLFNTSKIMFNTGWKVNTRIILSWWCFGHFLKRLFLSIKFTFWISPCMTSDLYPLSVNHDSKCNSFHWKSTSFE